MTDQKIPERCSFKIVELKKKWRTRTTKVEVHHEFDEVVTNQRIMMIYDFRKELREVEEAEKEHAAAMYNNKSKLLDTDDEHSLSSEAVRTGEEVKMLKKRLEQLKELHKDFDFTGKVVQHKLKFKDDAMITEMIYMIDKKTVDRFDSFWPFLENYEMLIRDYQEREKEQKWWMTQVAFGVDEAVSKAEWTRFVWFQTPDSFVLVPEEDLESAESIPVISTEETMIWKAREIIRRTGKASATMLQRELDISFPLAAQLIDQLEKEWTIWPQEWAKPRKVFWWPIQASENALDASEKDPTFEALIQVMMKINEASEIAKKAQEIFDTLATMFKWNIEELKVILEWRRYDLERIKETWSVERSILSIAIDEAWKCETWMNTIITLAAWFDFIEILKQYEE